MVGANGTYGPDDVDWDALAEAGYLHMGGPEFRAARQPHRADRRLGGTGIRPPRLPLADEEQVLGLTGAGDLEAGARQLVEQGVGCVVATCGAEGALIVDAAGAEQVPAFEVEVEVVDTTDCGDAFSAGFIRGLELGRGRRDAAVLGCAAAALVAQGLGTDHGDFGLADADALQ